MTNDTNDTIDYGLGVAEYEVRDYGVDHSQYFQGAGVAYTRFDHVFLGAGDTALDAFNEAVEMAAMFGYDTRTIAAPESADTSSAHDDCNVDAPDHLECELYRYIGVFVRRATK